MPAKTSLLAILVLIIFTQETAQSGTPAISATKQDEQAIRDLETKWELAWNHHDVKGMVSTYAPDSDAVNLAGEWFKGRPEFEKSLEELHSGKTKASVWTTGEVRVKFLTREIAMVHVYVESHGDKNPDGSSMAPRHVILTRVDVKRGGKWFVLASQATNIVPRATAKMSQPGPGNEGQ